MSTKFSILNEHLNLLKGTLFPEVFETENFTVAKSFQYNDNWNLIIPKSAEFEFDEVEKIVTEHSDKDFSIYISDKFNSDLEKALMDNGFSLAFVDYYLVKESLEMSEIDLEDSEKFLEVGEDDYEAYLEVTNSMFPEWEDGVEYTKLFYQFGRKHENNELRNYMITRNDEIVCVGSVIYSTELNLAYLHNSGTVEKYRRKGYFTLLKKLMINELVKDGITSAYGIVEWEAGSYFALQKLGFENSGKFWSYGN